MVDGFLPERYVGARAHDVVSGATTPEDLARACAEKGVECVQLACGKSFPWLVGSDCAGLTPGAAHRVRDELAASGTRIEVLGSYYNMIHPNVAARDRGRAAFIRMLQLAPHFGAPVVASETGSVNVDFSYTTQNFTDERFEEAAEEIRVLASWGERFGTYVGIEPGINHPINTPQRTKELLDVVDSPWLGVVLDPTAFINAANATPEYQLELCMQSAELFGDRILAMHLKDWDVVDGRFAYRNVGEGRALIDQLVSVVTSACPMLPVILEATDAAHVPLAAERVRATAA